MRLLLRVIRLEGRVKTPAKPVHVVFQRNDGSDETLVSRSDADDYDPKAMLIVVKFVEAKQI